MPVENSYLALPRRPSACRAEASHAAKAGFDKCPLLEIKNSAGSLAFVKKEIKDIKAARARAQRSNEPSERVRLFDLMRFSEIKNLRGFAGFRPKINQTNQTNQSAPSSRPAAGQKRNSSKQTHKKGESARWVSDLRGRGMKETTMDAWNRPNSTNELLNLDAADEASGGDVEHDQFVPVPAGKAQQDAVAVDVGAFDALVGRRHGCAIRRPRAAAAAGAQERAGDQRAHRHHAQRAKKDDEGERAAIAWGRCGSVAGHDRSFIRIRRVARDPRVRGAQGLAAGPLLVARSPRDVARAAAGSDQARKRQAQ